MLWMLRRLIRWLMRDQGVRAVLSLWVPVSHGGHEDRFDLSLVLGEGDLCLVALPVPCNGGEVLQP